jgi:hypothetical protein
MANKKKKKQQEVIVEEAVKGLPYNETMKTILDFCVLGYCLISLISLVVPILRLWYPLSQNPVYTNFFAPGYSFIFGDKIANSGTNESSTLTIKFNVRYFISYVSIVLACVMVGLTHLKKTKGYGKFFKLIASILFATAFVLIVGYNEELMKVLKSYSKISNTIKNIEFTVYGVTHLVSLGLGTVVLFYQACCEKIVKN